MHAWLLGTKSKGGKPSTIAAFWPGLGFRYRIRLGLLVGVGPRGQYVPDRIGDFRYIVLLVPPGIS
jgi:hypothetical protein